MQVKETVTLFESAVTAAPVLAISTGGVILIAYLFLWRWQKSEEERRKMMDERHATYFAQLDNMNKAVVGAMDRGTNALQSATLAQKESNEIMGGVRELMRDLKKG